MYTDRKFEGGVFSKSIDGGRSGAEIEFTRDSVRAVATTGQVFQLSYRDCALTAGGVSNRMIFCRGSNSDCTIFCEDKSFAEELSHASSGVLDDQIAQMRRSQRAQSGVDRRWAIGILIGLFLLIIGGYLTFRHGARVIAAAVPLAVDKKIGQLAVDNMDLEGEVIEDPVVSRSLEMIVNRLAAHAKIDEFDYNVRIVRSDQVNAFALPGGEIVVYTGLIKIADRPEQVAAVLAHEIAHATLRHGMERIVQSLGVAGTVNVLLGNMEGVVAAGAELFRFASMTSYSRSQESDADAEGLRMLYAAGIDVKGMPEFFHKMMEAEGDVPDAVAWLSTHPQHQQRIESMEAMIRQLPPQEPKPFDLDWDEVRRTLAPQAAGAAPQ